MRLDFAPALRPVVLVFALLALLTGCVQTSGPAEPAKPAEPDEPLTIRIVYGIPTATILGMMEAKQDILPNYGTEYVLEGQRIDASSEVANLLAAGEADIGITGTGPLVAANQRLDANLRIVADQIQQGPEGHNANWFVVREDSDIETIEDLRGKTLGSLGFGTAIDLVMRVALTQADIDPTSDVTVVQLPFPAMEANLREEKVDMAQFVPPFFQIQRANGGTRVLFRSVDIIPEQQTLFLAARGEFLDENPRRVQAFFDDYYRYLQYALDPDNREEMIQIGAEMQNLPPQGFLPWWNTQEDFYRSPEGMPNIDAIKAEQELLVEFGILEEPIDIDEVTDLSFIEQAAENIGD